MKNKVGVVSSTYAKYNTEELLDGISKAGFKYIELASAPAYFDHILPRPEDSTKEDIENTLVLCKKYGLELYCIAGHTRMMNKDDVKNLKKVIDYAQMAGVHLLTTDAGEVSSAEDEEVFYKKIAELGDYAQSKDVTICLEMHGNWFNNAKFGAEVIKKIDNPNVRMNYDSGNSMYYGGVKAEEDMVYALPYMSFFHLKERPDMRETWDFPAIGEGKLDLDKIFYLIKDYKGPISIEVEFDDERERTLEEINDAMVQSFETLKRYGYV